MQCLNCGFENIPGMPSCARCQSALEFGDVVVIPRRASRLRFMTRAHQVWYQLRAWVPSVSGLWPPWRPMTLLPPVRGWWPRWAPVTYSPSPWGALLANLVLPGVGQIRQKQRVFGYLILGSWLACLLLSLLTIATSASTLWFALAAAVHAIALISLFMPTLVFERVLIRAIFGALLFVGMQLYIYWPLTWLGSRFLYPIALDNIIANTTVENGDGVICEGPWMRPKTLKRGDLVLYRFDGMGDGAYVVQGGYGFDRIIGLPGETIDIDGPNLLINGQPSDSIARPLAVWPVMESSRFTLKSDEYFIVPSSLGMFTHGMGVRPMIPTVLLRGIGVVHRDDIIGRALYRAQPWSRMGAIR